MCVCTLRQHRRARPPCKHMGCKQRGFCGQRAFDHTTGQGYVKSQRGHYHDGIFTKRNKFNLLLHETFGGGFSPPAVAKINRLARKAQRSGIDRTAYPPHSRLSFVSHHAERISIASVKGVNRAIVDRRAKLASELSRRARRALRGLENTTPSPLSPSKLKVQRAYTRAVLFVLSLLGRGREPAPHSASRSADAAPSSTTSTSTTASRHHHRDALGRE